MTESNNPNQVFLPKLNLAKTAPGAPISVRSVATKSFVDTGRSGLTNQTEDTSRTNRTQSVNRKRARKLKKIAELVQLTELEDKVEAIAEMNKEGKEELNIMKEKGRSTYSRFMDAAATDPKILTSTVDIDRGKIRTGLNARVPSKTKKMICTALTRLEEKIKMESEDRKKIENLVAKMRDAYQHSTGKTLPPLRHSKSYDEEQVTRESMENIFPTKGLEKTDVTGLMESTAKFPYARRKTFQDSMFLAGGQCPTPVRKVPLKKDIPTTLKWISRRVNQNIIPVPDRLVQNSTSLQKDSYVYTDRHRDITYIACGTNFGNKFDDVARYNNDFMRSKIICRK